MEKVKLLDKGIIELPRKVREKFGLEKGTEFDLFFDSETIYLKRVFKSLKEKPFSEVVRPLNVDINGLLRCSLDVPTVAEGFYMQKGGWFYE